MTCANSRVPSGCVVIEPLSPLFIVDIEPVKGQAPHLRRLFLDLYSAVDFIGERDAQLRALFTPDWASADEVFLETVEEAFKFQPSNTYLLKFKKDTTVLWHPTYEAGLLLEEIDRIYPLLQTSTTASSTYEQSA